MKIRYVLCVLLCNFVSCFISTVENRDLSRDFGTSPVIPKKQQLSCGCYKSSADELTGLCWELIHACPTSPDKDACPTSPDKRRRSEVGDCPTTPPTPKVRRDLGCPTSPDKDVCPTTPIQLTRIDYSTIVSKSLWAAYFQQSGYNPSKWFLGRSA